MLEKIINSAKMYLLAAGFSLSAACGDTTIINNYYGSDGGKPVSADILLPVDAQQDSMTKPDNESLDSGSQEETHLCIGELSSYPEMFVRDGVFNGFFVVGESGLPSDNLAMTDIATSMRYTNELGESVPVEVVDAFKLDSEIADVTAQNLITIGNPCYNAVSAELLENPRDCTEGFTPGQGRIRLYKHDNGNYALLVAGYSGADTRLAGQVIALRYNELSGEEVRVEGDTARDAVLSCRYQSRVCGNLILSESNDYNVGDSVYSVTIVDMLFQDYAGGIHSTTFDVDGEERDILEGETQGFENGVLVELIEMFYQNYDEGGINSADFCLSEEK